MRATCLVLATSLLLAACASAPTKAPDGSLFDDSLFAAPSERIDPQDVFAASPQMLEFLATGIPDKRRIEVRREALFDALYSKGAPWLDYDATITHNAAEAFAARSGNCLSLVLMTAAFAKHAGLGVRYQSIYTAETWSRSGGLDYLNGHVNVALFIPNRPEDGDLVIDFLQVPPGSRLHSRELRESTIVAMYMNNRAVELLAQNEFDRAYWWAKAAAGQDPRFLGATNTLAVIYKLRGQLPHAEHALRWLLAIEPDNIVALDNLVRVLNAQGRAEEGSVLAARLKELRPVEPFHFYDLGMDALKAGDFPEAKQMFLKEMRRDADYDKFHAALALAEYELGNLAAAQAQMQIALDNSTRSADREAYARMLAHLTAGEHP